MQLDDSIEHPVDGVDSPGHFSGKSGRSFLEACCQGATTRRLILAVIEPHSAALRTDVDHYVSNVFGLELDRAVRTRTAVIRQCLPATLRRSFRKCRGFFALNGFAGEPKTVAMAAHIVSHGALRIRVEQMTVVRASQRRRE